MKTLVLYQLAQYITTYHFLSCLVVFLVLEVNEASGKSPTKTKLLLQNIRTHLTQKADEIGKEKEGELGPILGKKPKTRSEEEEEQRSDDLRPPKLLRAHHKLPSQVKVKSVTQTALPKAFSSFYRKPQKAEKSLNYRKLILPPDAVSFSEATDKPGKKTFNKRLASFQDTKRPSDTLNQPIRPKQKLPTITHAKSPKIDGEDLKADPSLQTVRKTLKRKAEVDGKETEAKIHKPKTKSDKKTVYGAKDKERAGSQAAQWGPFFAFPNEPFAFVSDPDTDQRNICRKHTQLYHKHLQRNEMWALMMYDASAKLSSGILRGNTNQYGDFDECLSINVVFKKSKNESKSFRGITGKYCLANIDMSTRSESNAIRKVQERVESFRFVKSTVNDPGHFVPRFSTINWGLCVPSACHAEDVDKFLKSRFDFFYNASELAFDVRVDDDNCVVKEDFKFEFYSKTTMTALFYLAVISLSLYATYFDMKAHHSRLSKDKNFEEESERNTADKDNCKTRQISEKEDSGPSLQGRGQNLVAAFSLKRNVGKLFTDKNEGSIECINGIRSIFTVMLYLAHKTIPLAMTPFINRVALTEISNQPITVVLRASIVYTDSFLLISGILTAYSLAKEMSEKKEISWIKKAVSRFIRLTPPLLGVVLFYAYIWDQLGSGPIWNLVVRRNSLLCRRFLWRNLLYVQNLFEFENMCAPQTHQLALDMQLSLLAPLFVHLMHKYDKVGVGALQALFIFSSIMRYITTFNNNLSVVVYHGMPVTQLYRTANLLYIQALHRASPYILGTVVGYHLKKFENQLHLPKAVAVVGWVLALGFGSYSLASPLRLASRSYRYNVQEAAQYAALSPVAWSLALSWVIAACHLGFGGKLNEFLRHKIFLVFSRISYSVYLTQFLVFFYQIGVKKNAEMFTLAKSFSVAEFSMVLVVSVIATLLLDFPSIEIKNIILNGKSKNVFVEESNISSETLQEGEDGRSDTISGEYLQENTEELSEEPEDEGGSEEEREEDGDENSDEGGRSKGEIEDVDEIADEEGGGNERETGEDVDESSNEEIIEAVFEIRPLKRFSRRRFSDKSDNRESGRKDAN